MKKENTRQAKQVKSRLRKRVSKSVTQAFPGCVAVFAGRGGHVAPRVRKLSFRVKDERTDKFVSNVIWLNIDYDGPVTVGEVRDWVRNSNK